VISIQREPIRKNQFGTKILGGADGTYEEGKIQQEPIRKAGVRRSFLNPDPLLLLVRKEELSRGQ